MALADALKGFKLDKFRVKAKHAVGVDLGSTSLKILQLKGFPGKYSVVRWAYLPLPNSGPDVPGPERRAQAIALLSDFVSKLKKNAPRQTVFSVSGNAVIVRYVKFAKMSREDLSKMIEVEAEPYIPFAIPEVHLDFHMLGDVVEDGQKKVETILVAAKKEIVQSRMEVIQQVGLDPILIDVDAFAVGNAYEANRNPSVKETVLMVHMGAAVTTMIILENGVPRVVRDVFLAGNTIGKALIRNFQCDPKQAEVLKGKTTLLVTQEDRDKANESGDKEILQLSTVMMPVMKDLLSEIQRSLDFYLSQGQDRQVTRVLLSGGASRLGNIASYFSQELRLPVEVFDPFSRIEGAGPIPPDLRPLFAVAVGLAVRRDGDYQ